MIEVFKTNVDDPAKAAWLIEQIAKIHSDYTANFDLEDCDRIMRVKTPGISIDSQTIIALLNASGFVAELLENEIGMI
jgi:hypothetical protein